MSCIPAKRPVFKLGASAINLETAFQEIDPATAHQHIDFKLREAYASLSPAVITAGTFAAGEEGKAEIFKPRDIGTTAGTPGDIQATVESLPGTQRVGYTEGLFVRGGSGRESKYMMDGLIFPDPYYSHTPSLKQRGRLDPFLFSGTVFSAGGYSAQYGQALSSVLILTSLGMPDSTVTGGGIHTYGGNVFHTHRWKNVSLYANASYNNMAAYHSLSPQKTDWSRSPVNKELKLVLRAKAGKNALLKVYGSLSGTSLAINLHQPEVNGTTDFRIKNSNILLNANYTKFFNDNRSSLYAGISASSNGDRMHEGPVAMRQSDYLGQAKILFKHSFSQNVRFLSGGEFMTTRLFGRIDSLQSTVLDPLVALFAEAEASPGRKFALRLGLRSEYSGYARNLNLVPRTSLAWKFSRSSQVSLSYGIFYQLPDPLAMLYNPGGLSPEKAIHYIANYQYEQDERTFRTEIYYKRYDNLVTEYYPQHNYPGQAGYARGFEVFFRDRKTIPGLDAWVSYSYTDSKRKTIVPGELVTPDYVSAHTVSLVSKYWFGKPALYVSASYHYSGTRKYAFIPEDTPARFMPIPAYSSLDMSLSKPMRLFRQPALFFLSLQNIWGTDKLLGYARIPSLADPLQIYRSEKRSLFFGIFISMYNN